MKLGDDEIARRIRRGDPRAFDALYDRMAGPLVGYLTGMVGDRTSAEDILQETMVRIYRNIDRYKERGAFRAWVYRIATNLALSELRRARYFADTLDETLQNIPDLRGPDAQERLEARERKTAVRDGIDSLPDDQKAVLLLRVRRGMGIREIAEVLREPEGTVKSRLHYGVRRLRGLLSGEEKGGGRKKTAANGAME